MQNADLYGQYGYAQASANMYSANPQAIGSTSSAALHIASSAYAAPEMYAAPHVASQGLTARGPLLPAQVEQSNTEAMERWVGNAWGERSGWT